MPIRLFLQYFTATAHKLQIFFILNNNINTVIASPGLAQQNKVYSITVLETIKINVSIQESNFDFLQYLQS